MYNELTKTFGFTNKEIRKDERFKKLINCIKTKKICGLKDLEKTYQDLSGDNIKCRYSKISSGVYDNIICNKVLGASYDLKTAYKDFTFYNYGYGKPPSITDDVNEIIIEAYDDEIEALYDKGKLTLYDVLRLNQAYSLFNLREDIYDKYIKQLSGISKEIDNLRKGSINKERSLAIDDIYDESKQLLGI